MAIVIGLAVYFVFVTLLVLFFRGAAYPDLDPPDHSLIESV